MVRDASPADIPAMLGMAERFIAVAWARVGVPMDHETCEALLTGLMAAEEGILLVNDDCTAMLGAMVHPWHFNANILTATELFWWAEPEAKDARALWAMAEAKAEEMGAQTFNMACQHHMRAEALGRLYQARGYEPSEHIYIRTLS